MESNRLGVGGIKAGLCHLYSLCSVSGWGHGNTARRAKAVAVCAVVVWVVVIACGPLLAY
ncbi:hypothetical protein [Pontibacter brevis]